MPAQQIAQNLAYINWTVLTGLAIGSFATVILARAVTEAPRGYLAFTAICAAAFAALAWLSDGALPVFHPGTADPSVAAPRPAGLLAADATPREAALLVLALTSLAWGIAIRRGPPGGSRPERVLATVGIVAGAAALTVAAYAWGGGVVTGVPLLIQFAVLSAATGGVFAAMVLGHWYLVTPRLGERPLVLLARGLEWTVGLQLVLFVAWLATGAGAGTAPFAALVGPWALFVWLRLIVGLIFPLIVSWAAVQTAKSRSMESATGLLYINVGMIAAGTILASGLFFGAGLLT